MLVSPWIYFSNIITGWLFFKIIYFGFLINYEPFIERGKKCGKK